MTTAQNGLNFPDFETRTKEHVEAIAHQSELHNVVLIAEIFYQHHFIVVAEANRDNEAADTGDYPLHLYVVLNYQASPDAKVQTTYRLMNVIPGSFIQAQLRQLGDLISQAIDVLN